MARTEFTVNHNEIEYKCYIEAGKVWYEDQNGNPATGMREPHNINSLEEAKEIIITTLNGHGM